LLSQYPFLFLEFNEQELASLILNWGDRTFKKGLVDLFSEWARRRVAKEKALLAQYPFLFLES